jgi:broad specificity phosphatase PhoE
MAKHRLFNSLGGAHSAEKPKQRSSLSPKETTVIYFFRHGQTPSDRENRFCGWNNEDLTPKGVADVHSAVDTTLSKIKFGRIFSDDLTRTMHTAKLVHHLSQTKDDIIVNNGARTWGIGSKLSGKPKNDENLKEKQYYIENPDELPKGEDAETLNESRRRWLSFLAYVIANTPHDMPSLVCCHSNGFKVTSDTYGKKVKVHPSGVAKMTISKDGVTFDVLREGPAIKESDVPSAKPFSHVGGS